MQLDQYISDLLYRYECVILPGFGAFLTQYHSAQIHKTTHAFYPPKKMLSFNAQLTQNDGLLANYISKTEDVTHEKANFIIASYVSNIKTILSEGGSITLKNVGSFVNSAERNLQFEPSYHLNYLTEAFGLSTFTSKGILREELKKEVTVLEQKTPIAFTPERKAATSWLTYAAAAVVAFGVLGTIGYQYVQNVEDYNYASREEADLQLEDKIQEATFVIPNPMPAITINAAQPKGSYHIVAGAFRQEENAEKRVGQLKAKGFEARQIGKNKYGLHQVVYGSYVDAKEALKALRAVRASDNKEAWLLSQVLD